MRSSDEASRDEEEDALVDEGDAERRLRLPCTVGAPFISKRCVESGPVLQAWLVTGGPAAGKKKSPGCIRSGLYDWCLALGGLPAIFAAG